MWCWWCGGLPKQKKISRCPIKKLEKHEKSNMNGEIR
jgi:hypothetical protein